MSATAAVAKRESEGGGERERERAGESSSSEPISQKLFRVHYTNTHTTHAHARTHPLSLKGGLRRFNFDISFISNASLSYAESLL